MQFPDFINCYYDVIYKGEKVNTEDFSNVDEFLLGDIHNSPGHSEINSLFINTFSIKSDVVLVEAIPSLQQIEKDQAFHSVWLKTESKIMGWDSGTLEEMLGSPLCQKIGDIEREGQVLVRQILDPNDTCNKEDLSLKLGKKLMNSNPLALEYIIHHDSISKKMAKSFCGRVKSMKDSLIKVKETSTRTFLIAGTKHLQEDTTNPDFSLGDFPEFLKTRNTVILFPKGEKAQEMGLNRKMIAMAAFLNATLLSKK